jgi:MFS family permease
MGLRTPLDISAGHEMDAADAVPLGLDVVDRAALQRRTLRILAGSQILAALGGSGAAAGALLAFEITGSDALASLPLALVVVGASATVVPISAISRRAGRRVGLTLALSTAAVGAVFIVVAGALESFPLLCMASIAFGAGNTAVLLARYAAADLSSPEERGRAISRVVFATTFGAVAGPNLLAPAGDLANAFGLPGLTGLYLVSAAAFALGAVVLFVLLRPDPLQIAIGLERRRGAHDSGVAARIPLRRLFAPQAAVTGLATIVIANFVMVAVMTMAPVHMRHQGHSLEFVGFVISLHIAGMFAPSPITGWLTDRVGSPPVAAFCGLMLMIAGILSAIGGHSRFSFAFGLFLLGVGWNAGLIAGSTLLASAVPAADRPRAEGVGDLSMGIVAASATALAGPIVGLAGYATLALAGSVAAAAIGPFLIAVARHPRPAETARARRVLT